MRDPEKNPLIKSLPDNKLSDYIETHILGNSALTISSKKKLITKILLGVLGATWGIPWINAASEAAVIFPSGAAQDAFRIIFAAGIVATVGADGTWIMLNVGRMLDADNQKMQNLMPQKHQSIKIKATKGIITAILAALSCISSVVASIKYNNGSDKFLSILTLLVNFGSGVYGYNRFIAGLSYRRNIFSNNDLNEQRNFLIARLSYLRNQNILIPDNLDNAESFMSYLMNDSNFNIIQKVTPNLSWPRIIFQGFFAATIPAAASVVSIMLTKDFIQKNLVDILALALAVSIISEIPGYTTSLITTFKLFGRLFDMLTCQQNERSLAGSLYPKLTMAVLLVAFFLAQTAPTAAAVITYNTIQELKNAYLTWSATGAMIAARYIFSNFTLNDLTNDLITWFARYQKNPQAMQHQKIDNLITLLEQTDETHFSDLLSETKFNSHKADTTFKDLYRGNYTPTSFSKTDETKQEDTEETIPKSWCNYI